MIEATKHTEHVRTVAAKIQTLPLSEARSRSGPAYRHMPALLADAVLQAGLNYRTVVQPRVSRILALWAETTSTAELVRLIETVGACYILKWTHPEKLQRFVGLAEFLSFESVDTVDDFALWLRTETHTLALLRMRGVGPKTVDYIKNLVGIPRVAVDRHVRAFVESAGIYGTNYAQIRLIVEDAAASLRLCPALVDHAIWLHGARHRSW